jgi:hypothetical protein
MQRVHPRASKGGVIPPTPTWVTKRAYSRVSMRVSKRANRECTTRRGRRRARKRRGTAGMATSGLGSEEGHDGIRAFAEPDEGGKSQTGTFHLFER